MNKLTPFLCFNADLDEIIAYYREIFPNLTTSSVRDLGNRVKTADIVIEGQKFMALSGGPDYQFTPALSLFVNCTGQEEVDRYWSQLADGGTPLRCGWITDRYGLSWQIIPDVLGKLMSDPDPKKSRAVMEAMMKMVKIDVAELESAHKQA